MLPRRILWIVTIAGSCLQLQLQFPYCLLRLEREDRGEVGASPFFTIGSFFGRRGAGVEEDDLAPSRMMIPPLCLDWGRVPTATGRRSATYPKAPWGKWTRPSGSTLSDDKSP
jgi:hypothetical protein